jgi:hypothetical protein
VVGVDPPDLRREERVDGGEVARVVLARVEQRGRVVVVAREGLRQELVPDHRRVVAEAARHVGPPGAEAVHRALLPQVEVLVRLRVDNSMNVSRTRTRNTRHDTHGTRHDTQHDTRHGTEATWGVK